MTNVCACGHSFETHDVSYGTGGCGADILGSTFGCPCHGYREADDQ